MESTRSDRLIETLRLEPDGKIRLWPWHLARLRASADALGWTPPPADLLDRIRDAACPPPQGHAQGPTRVRVLYDADGAVEIQAAPLPPLGTPVVLRLAVDVLGPHAVLSKSEVRLRHKLTVRPWYDEATAWLASDPGCFDLVYGNDMGALCEGSRCNVYVLTDGHWYTPPVTDGCLPGTQRAALLAEKRVRVASLTRQDMQRADGLRVSNALRGWVDAVLLT